MKQNCELGEYDHNVIWFSSILTSNVKMFCLHKNVVSFNDVAAILYGQVSTEVKNIKRQKVQIDIIYLFWLPR